MRATRRFPMVRAQRAWRRTALYALTSLIALTLAVSGAGSAQQVSAGAHAPPAQVSRVPVVTVTPGTEPLHTVLAREADSAATHGQLALVDMGTKGCEICHIFHNTLTDSVLIGALRGARLIEADLDEWSFKATIDGFEFSGALPILFVVTPEGRIGPIFNHSGWDDQLKKLGASAIDGRVLGPPLRTFLDHVRDSVMQAKKH